MRANANSRVNAGKGLRATSLVCLLLALCPMSRVRAQPPVDPQLIAPAVEADPFGSEPVWTPPASEPANALRNNAVIEVPRGDESILTPPANPPVPPQQKVIPITKPGGQSDLVVEDYHGQISLMVRDAPLRQVVALVAETQKLNIVFAAPAETKITASFDRVPWEQVLDSLLTASGHTWTTHHGVITVTSIDQAGMLPPATGGRRVEVFELDFASAIDVDQTVKGLLSPAGKSWIMETNASDNRRTREAVAVVDYPANLQQIAEYIILTDQPPRQVLIEANILEVELSSDCRSGIDLGAISNSASGNVLDFDPVGLANSAASPAFFLEATGGSITALVELLQTTTDAKTLASPKVLAVSGQLSRIQIGGEIGYRGAITTNASQTSTQEVQFLETGVILDVTPRVTRDGRVLMRVKPEVSTGELSSDGLPNKQTTNIESDVMLCDGQGMVIGGLIQEVDRNTQQKLPWFGDLPYVGILFQRRNVVKSKAEIIVTLVPHIQPYTAGVQSELAHEVMRTYDPIVTGPLNRYPRPYEPQLYDTFRNPRRPCLTLLHALPPVEDVEPAAYCPPVYEQMQPPCPPVEEFPLEYPPQEARNSTTELHK